MDVGTVTSKGQLVIPSRLRKKLGIGSGTRVSFIEGEGEIILRPLTPAYIRSVCGILKDEVKGSLTQELLKERAKERRKEEAQGESRRRR